jgi:alpha-mannosidase
MTSGNEGGQIQGMHEFNYWIVPLVGPPNAARLSRLGQRLAAGVRVVQLEHRDVAVGNKPGQPKRDLPLTHSFAKIDSPAAVVTAIHRTSEDNAGTVRMFNPTGRRIEALLAMSGTSDEAQLTDLEGKPVGKAEQDGDEVKVSLDPKQIVTVQLME